MNADHPRPAVRFRVRLTPRARTDAITGWEPAGEEPVLRVRVSAPPLDGKANASLLRLLSRALAQPPRDLSIVRGLRSRDKLLEVRGLSMRDVRERLHRAAQ